MQNVREMGHKEDPDGPAACEDGGWGQEPRNAGVSGNWKRPRVDSPRASRKEPSLPTPCPVRIFRSPGL